MPWITPSLQAVRQQTRDAITGQLQSGSMIPNSVLRVLADALSGLAYLVLLYLDKLSQQFLPDTADEDWLKNRHAQIWLGGYKTASFSAGSATLTGDAGVIVPAGTSFNNQVFETTAQITIGDGATPVAIQAILAGSIGNLDPGTTLQLDAAISGVDSGATVVTLTGGANEETADELRIRVLNRIRQPPMGGDADDYVAWALEVPGVTRAWCSPLEMGAGSVTVRFMMDDLRKSVDPFVDGFPLPSDVAAVHAYVDTKRPVAVKDFFVVAPLPEPIDFTIQGLDNDTPSVRAIIAASVTSALKDRAKPAFALNGVGHDAQEIYTAWISEAVLDAAGVGYFDLLMSDHPMPTKGSIAVLGAITYVD